MRNSLLSTGYGTANLYAKLMHILDKCDTINLTAAFRIISGVKAEEEAYGL